MSSEKRICPSLSRSGKNCALLAILVFFLFIPWEKAFCWGFKAHRTINKNAIETLPLSIKPFFSSYKDFLIEHSIDPDIWRKEYPETSGFHYIDIDMYGDYPYSQLPRDFNQAVKKYGLKMVRERGTLPWKIDEYTDKLSESMRRGEVDEIILTSAVLGHYVADAHVPLHTVENYDGQFTGNDGIHRRWETFMIEIFESRYKSSPDSAVYIEDPLDFAFKIILEGNRLAHLIFAADDSARKVLSEKEKGLLMGRKEKIPQKYFEILYRYSGELAWQRMDAASSAIGSLWYTAWIKAGRPELAGISQR